MKSKSKILSDSQLSSLVSNAICVTMSLKNLLEDELTLLQKYFAEMRSTDTPSQIPEDAMFYSMTSALYRKANITMGELSKSISAPMSSTTRMMNWLVDNGYAQRLSDPDDRRIVRVTLTKEGRGLHKYIESHIIQRVKETMQLLTTEEQATIIKVFEKLGQVFNLKEAK
ncbi:MAG: MarR family transcriptional regulator [Dehalococcoidia bacterium]|jgi:DNA-binding MarR family transcriptional regulator